MAAIAAFRKPADKWTRLDPPPEAHYGLREGLERQQCPSVMFQLVSMEGYTTGELFFSVSPCSRGSTDSWCYKPIAQRAAEGSGISSPMRELKLLLQAVVALCRTLACLTSLAVRNSLSSAHSEALTGRRTNCPFPCFCQHRLMASKLSRDSQDAGHLCYLASPLTWEVVRFSLAQSCRMDQWCCCKRHPLWASPFPLNEKLPETQTNTNSHYKIPWTRISNILHHLSPSIVKPALSVPLQTNFKWFHSIGFVHSTLRFEL